MNKLFSGPNGSVPGRQGRVDGSKPGKLERVRSQRHREDSEGHPKVSSLVAHQASGRIRENWRKLKVTWNSGTLNGALGAVWQDWVIYWNLGNFYLSIIFLVRSFLRNFYRHLATFYWSLWWKVTFGDVEWWVVVVVVIMNGFLVQPHWTLGWKRKKSLSTKICSKYVQFVNVFWNHSREKIL